MGRFVKVMSVVISMLSIFRLGEDVLSGNLGSF